MKFMKGEKDKIRKLITEKEERLGQKLPREERIRMAKKIHRQMKRKVRRNMLLAALGIGGVAVTAGLIAGAKEDPAPRGPEIETEAETSTERETDSFRETYGVDLEEIRKKAILKEINNLDTKDEVLKFLKDMYIEEYERQTGDTKLTTDDIQINYGTQNYAYTTDDGEIFLHTENPQEVADIIKEQNIQTETVENIMSYQIIEKNSQDIIDAYVKFGKRRVEAKDIALDKPYVEKSILKEMGDIFEAGLDLRRKIGENDVSEEKLNDKKEALVDAIYNYNYQQPNKKVYDATLSKDGKVEIEKTEEDGFEK